MPLRHKSAQKRARQTKKRTERNKKFKTLIKNSVKDLTELKDKSKAQAELKKTVAVLDRSATKRILPKNKVARMKSKLAKKVNKLS